MDRLSEEEIIDKVMMIEQWKVSGDIYTQNELNAIGELLDLYDKEKEKNKELEEDNAELRRLKNKLSIATAIALGGRKIPISKKTLNELNDMFSIEIEYRPFYDDYVFYAK